MARCIAFDPAGLTLAGGREDGKIDLWDVESGTLTRTMEWDDQTDVCVTLATADRRLATGHSDGAIKIWEPGTGALLLTLPGHANWVQSVAFDSAGTTLASAGSEGYIKFWDMESGKLLRSVRAGHEWIWSLAFNPAGGALASAGGDSSVRLWDCASGELIYPLMGHSQRVFTVAFNHTGGLLASGAEDRTILLWDSTTGKLLQKLEGHEHAVITVAFSHDDRLMASMDIRGAVQLWNCQTWEPVGAIHGMLQVSWAFRALAFHPTSPMLATVASVPSEKPVSVINLWKLDTGPRLGEAQPSQGKTSVHHTTAKIVLVGDSGMGKTGLGWRLAHGEFREQASTHGQQFWVLDQLSARRSDGTECEAILWDLAGQPDYRLIHALFLDDADLALILFDPTDGRDPLHGVEFWLKQLSNNTGATILVAARADRGSPTLTRAELESFCKLRGIQAYLMTSAFTGEGLDELIHHMESYIRWDEKPATVTTVTFKYIKDYVLQLKETLERKQIVVSAEELRRRLPQFTEGEIITAVGHLENYGYVKRLRTSTGDARILLAPELLNNLASSFVLEARRNEKGLGALEEKKLLSGDYPFRELEGLEPSERDILLDSAALLFLEHHVAFRETDPLTARSYLVFPELINLKRPLLGNETPTEDGVAYTLSGSTENVYASLVVLLGYTQTFTRTDQWHSQARYEMNGQICGFRQEAERDGELDFVLYFGATVSKPVRTLFQGLFESFVGRHNLTVFRYEPIVCGQCHRPLDRGMIRDRLRERKSFAFCPECGERLPLPQADEPIQFTQQERRQVDEQRSFAAQRSRFEQVVFQLSSYVEARELARPECFVSYAWGESGHERWVERSLATDLQKAGIKVVLDRWENARVGASVSRFIERIDQCDRVVVVGTPLYRKKYENKETSAGYVVAAETDMISNRMLGTEAEKETILPVLLAGDKKSSLPPLLQSRQIGDFRDERTYLTTVFDLIVDVYRIPRSDRVVADLRESLRAENFEGVRTKAVE